MNEEKLLQVPGAIDRPGSRDSRLTELDTLKGGTASIATDEERLASIHDAQPDQGEKRYRGTCWYRQPLKGMLITYWVASCIFLLPIYFLEALVRPRPRESWTAATAAKVAFIRRITRLIPLTGFHTGGRDLSKVPTGLKRSKHVWIPPIAEHRIKGFIKQAQMDDRSICTVEASRACAFWYGGEPGPDGDVVLQMHGGAYILGSAHESEFAAKIFRGLCERSGYSCLLALDYRLALQDPFPAQLLDALAAYSYLTETLNVAPSRITLCGDSAGANLALALCRYLRDTAIMPMPGHLLLLSPWCDPTFSYRHKEGSFTKNYKSDIVDIKVTPEAVKFFLGVLPASALFSPFISPITTPKTRILKDVTQLFTKFPRTLILISEGERLWDEAMELQDRMQHCAVNISLHTERDAVHDWLQFDFSEPMSTSSFAAIREWRQRTLVDEAV